MSAETRPYGKIRDMVERRGGTMIYRRQGYRYGAWEISLGGKRVTVESMGFAGFQHWTGSTSHCRMFQTRKLGMITIGIWSTIQKHSWTLYSAKGPNQALVLTAGRSVIPFPSRTRTRERCGSTPALPYPVRGVHPLG